MLTVYEKPTCSTCRNLGMLLKEKGVDFEKINYIIDPLGRGELANLHRLLGVPAREMVRVKEAGWQELGIDAGSASDATILDALAAHPALLQRPIVVNGDRAVIARPAEKVLDIL